MDTNKMADTIVATDATKYSDDIIKTTIKSDTSKIVDTENTTSAAKKLDKTATSTVKPAYEHDSRLQLLNIAQELQDMIYELVFEDNALTLFDHNHLDTRDKLPELLCALKTNQRQDIFYRAEEIYYKTTSFCVKQ